MGCAWSNFFLNSTVFSKPSVVFSKLFAVFLSNHLLVNIFQNFAWVCHLVYKYLNSLPSQLLFQNNDICHPPLLFRTFLNICHFFTITNDRFLTSSINASGTQSLIHPGLKN